MIVAFTSRLAVSKHSETTDDDRFDMVVVYQRFHISPYVALRPRCTS